jgi:hypothetical protein
LFFVLQWTLYSYHHTVSLLKICYSSLID